VKGYQGIMRGVSSLQSYGGGERNSAQRSEEPPHKLIKGVGGRGGEGDTWKVTIQRFRIDTKVREPRFPCDTGETGVGRKTCTRETLRFQSGKQLRQKGGRETGFDAMGKMKEGGVLVWGG